MSVTLLDIWNTVSFRAVYHLLMFRRSKVWICHVSSFRCLDMSCFVVQMLGYVTSSFRCLNMSLRRSDDWTCHFVVQMFERVTSSFRWLNMSLRRSDAWTCHFVVQIFKYVTFFVQMLEYVIIHRHDACLEMSRCVVQMIEYFIQNMFIWEQQRTQRVFFSHKNIKKKSNVCQTVNKINIIIEPTWHISYFITLNK